MTDRQAILLVRALDWIVIVASVGWISFFGGTALMWATTFWGWFGGSYSIQGALWLEAALFIPCAVLWTVVCIVQWLIRRYYSITSATFVSTMERALRSAQHLFGLVGGRIFAAVCVFWPLLTQIPGLVPRGLSAFGFDPDRVLPVDLYLSTAMFMAIFTVPPAAVAATILAVRRAHRRLGAAR